MQNEEVVTKLKRVEECLRLHNHYEALRICEELNDDLKDILQPHWSIQSEDEQYSDPEMWDHSPIYENLQRPLDLLYFIDQWFLSDEGYDINDIESMDKANRIITNLITDLDG